ncbi:DUF5658 family protein [Halorussus pelagicus]|uniref:DUF5658 family protein n=1 Tax=Halorussus pelagicus TaxID=2505977 RepID=UPI001FB64019|nr:DUF5658 family protein [Halorussus pelagicus]
MSSDRLRWPTAARDTPRRLNAPLAGIGGWERALWLLVGVALVGDLLTTYYGLKIGLTESNPVARTAMERFGFGALVGLKLFAVGIGVCCRWIVPDEHGLLVPAGLAVPWTGAVVVNLALYATVLG